MTPIGHRWSGVALLVATALAACSTPDASPSASPHVLASVPVLGCLSIGRAECEFVAMRLLGQLDAARDAPFAIQVQLHGCANDGPCPRTLAARQGMVTAEYADGRGPVTASVAGPPDAPTFGNWSIGWAGVSEPRSPRVTGAGPFPYELGHCGLTWQVDFDGSFWVPIGEVDGDASPISGDDRGQIRLLGPDVAEYRNGRGFVARLARFPGPKHIWGCA